MTLYADPNRCPDCHEPLTRGATRCVSCDLELSGPLGQELFVVLGRADDLLRRMRVQQRGRVTPERVPVGASVAAPLSAGRPLPSAENPPLPAPPGGPVPPRASAVPKVLLALGAVCVLVAALVFLAVTWSLLGVGGRTAILVGLTVGTGILTGWLARRTLRVATEALALVTIGLATLDVVGARSAGWLGDLTDATFTAVLGALLVAGGLAAVSALARTPVRQLVVGELAAVLGVLLLSIGLVDGSWSSYAGRQLVALLAATAVAAVVWALVRDGENRYRVAAWGVSTIAVVNWLALFGAGLEQLGNEPSVASVWGDLDGWPLLVAAGSAAALSAVRRLTTLTRVAAAGAALVALLTSATAPAYDESTTVLTLAVLAAVTLAVAVIALVPRPWGAVGLGAGFVAAVYLGIQLLVMLGTAATRYSDAADSRWRGDVWGRFDPLSSSAPVGEPWLLPLCVAALLALLGVTVRLAGGAPRQPHQRLTLAAGATLVTTLAATLVLWPVPVWTVLALALAAAVIAAAAALGRLGMDPSGSRESSLASGVALAAALPLSLYDEHLTAVALGVTVLVAAALHLSSRSTAVVLTAGAVAPLGLAALVATIGEIAQADRPWTALVGLLVLAAVVLGRPALPSRLRTGEALGSLEGGAAVGALLLGLGGVAATDSSAGWGAVYLTVAGVAATALALLREDRRQVGWLGGALLVLATWVRLDEIGVQEPEPYTLPSAVALLVVGWVHLRRHPEATTPKALGPGLALALVPSLLWVLAEPLSLRAALLGLACLALVVSGAQLRLAAPFVYGAAVGLLVVLREAAPVVGETVPRWSLIGAAGVLLIGLGVTWEQRMREARAAAGYVRRMR